MITYETRASLAQAADGQNPVSPPKWHPQSSRPESTGPVVFGRGFLRPARFDPGQIRNAASGSERGDDNPCRRCPFRLFSSGFLQSPEGLFSRRLSGPSSQTARPQRRAQANSGDPSVCRANPVPGAIPPNARLGPSDSGKVCDSSTPKNRGASFARCEKKTASPVVGEARLKPLLPAASLTEHYERLRAYVLAQDGSSALRWGQGALMARGTAAWMQVAGELIPPVRSAPSPAEAEANVPPLVQNEVIRLMGEAVLNLVNREWL